MFPSRIKGLKDLHAHFFLFNQLPSPVPEAFRGSCMDFAFDHSAGLVAVRTENYCIQLYSLFDDREISEVHKL